MWFRAIFTAAICFLFLTSGCSLSHIMPDHEQQQSANQRHLKLIFFSDDEHMGQEVAYYDALLDLKKNFPNRFQIWKFHMKKASGKKRLKSFQACCLFMIKKYWLKLKEK